MLRTPSLVLSALLALSAPLPAQHPLAASNPATCRDLPEALRRNPTEAELRCRFEISGPGRFGLLSYLDVPVYQPATPMPGTHVVGVTGHARPLWGESYEQWEWRVLRTEFGEEAQRVYRGLEVLDPRVAARILHLEGLLAAEGIVFSRRETWRAPERQAYLFQQGRSRPGPLATATLTSWHSQVDERGNPAGRAVDYDVPARQMPRFHDIAWRVGLQSFGHDSNDPGHVFLPDQEEIAPAEIALLRTIERVPEVTLATGLPVDRGLPPGGREELRAAALEFASLPFIRHVAAALVARRTLPSVITSPFGSRPAETVSVLSARGLPASGDGGAPGAPRRSAAPSEERSPRSTDGGGPARSLR